jgi:opacity protein-like surface antigen
MRPIILSALLASSVLTFAPAAAADERPYVSLSAGAANLRDAELEYPGNADRDRVASFDNGYVIAAAYGRSIGERFRLEGEIAYRANDEGFIMPGQGGDGHAGALSLMANGYWDIPVNWRLRPYLGMGLGAAAVSHEDFVVADLGVPARTLVDDSGWGFAYQAMIGARAPIGDNWLWGAEYRYFGVAEPKLDDADGFTYDTDYDSHALMVSLARRL